MAKHLVLAGAGHAHLQTIALIAEIVARGHKVTVVGPERYHYYSGMGPGLLGGTYTLEDIRFDSHRQVERRGGRFIRGEIVRIDALESRIVLGNGDTLGYDVLSCNLGSQVVDTLEGTPGYPVFSVKPISNLYQGALHICRDGRDRKLEIAIVGGGGAAVEVAGNIMHRAANEHLALPRVTVFCRRHLLPGADPRVRHYCRSSLRRRGVTIVEHTPVLGFADRTLLLINGEKIPVDMVFTAHGIQPSAVPCRSGLRVGDDGGLMVNRYLQAESAANIFGGGDCISLAGEPLARVGVHAVRQNPVLAYNLLAALENRSLRPFVPNHTYLQIYNIGGKRGAAWRGRICFSGYFAFLLKDGIDRRFMRRFR